MKFEKCGYSSLESFDAYLKSLSSPIDSFLESLLLESNYYRIVQEGGEVGFFAINKKELLTQFHVVGEARRFAQELFTEILGHFNPKAAFVPTCDEFFLSHALDQHTELKKQALFFCDDGIAVSVEHVKHRPAYRVAELADIPALNAIDDSIVDDPEEWIARGELHVGYQGDALLAIGIIEPSHYWSDRASIGMLTHESVRQQGIGKQTLLYLKNICRDSGFEPVAGCGYGNTNSQKTLSGAGMVSVTRLLKLTL